MRIGRDFNVKWSVTPAFIADEILIESKQAARETIRAMEQSQRDTQYRQEIAERDARHVAELQDLRNTIHRMTNDREREEVIQR